MGEDQGGFDLGSLLQPPQETPTGKPASTWTEYLQDPVARSALMGTALQLMTGGWGNGTQQLAAGLGAGAESAAGTASALAGAEKVKQDQEEKASDRASREKVAKIAADSRAEVAGIRSQAMLERAAMIRSPTGPAEMKAYSEAYNKYYKIQKDNALLSANPKTDLEIQADADIYAKNILAGMRGVAGGPGAPGPMQLGGPGAGSEVTLPNSAVGGQTEKGGGTVAGGKAAAGGKARTLADALNMPDKAKVLEPLLKTPEGRASIEKARPDWKDELQYYKNREVIPDFIKNLFGGAGKADQPGGAG